jgi:transposase
LVNTAAVRQYEGLKHTDDEHDAFWLAHLMRLGILPTGYIYPKTERGLRDLGRQRMRLVQHRSPLITSVQNQVWRSTAVRLRSDTIKGRGNAEVRLVRTSVLGNPSRARARQLLAVLRRRHWPTACR